LPPEFIFDYAIENCFGPERVAVKNFPAVGLGSTGESCKKEGAYQN
jgi:hypothetical protein